MKYPTSTQKNKWADHYSQKAKKERYPARSVYKLMEIQKKNSLIRKGDHVLDLGCFPGSWLLYAAELTGKNGHVVGIDLKPIEIKLPEHVEIHTADVLSLTEELLETVGNKFDVVMSDMAPSTTGNKHVDSARSFNLCQAALWVAQKALKPGGAFICKIFQGEDFEEFSNAVKMCFKKRKIFKPQSSRKASKEIYIIGIEKLDDE